MLGCGRAEPTMNLAWIRDTEDINDTDKGSILHEFGHVLGLGHEHQSPKLKGTVTLKPDGVWYKSVVATGSIADSYL